jgi:hypothetical protein
MKSLCKYTLCLALGLSPVSAFAQDLQWRNAATPATPTTSSGIVPVSLSRPVPINDAPLVTLDPARPIVRGQNADEIRPLPPGPTLGPGLTVSTPSPFTTAQEQKLMPKADGQTPPATGPMPTPGVWGGPMPGGGDQLFGITGQSGVPCGQPCPDTCCSKLTAFWNWVCNLGHHGACCAPCGNPCPTPCCNPCPNVCCNPCGDACCRPRYWIYADYLLWIPQNQAYPPLVAVSPPGTPQALAGLPGSSTIAFNRFNDPARSGMRIGGGVWFHENGNWGMDFNYWFLASASQDAVFGGPGTIVTRPFVSATEGAAAAELVNFPGVVDGTVTIHQYQQLWGLDTNVRRKLCCGPNGWVDLLMGYRHFELNEGLDITENLALLDPVTGAIAQTRVVSDQFHTRNNYNGVQLGVAGEWRFLPRWSLFGSYKGAVGVNHEQVEVNGFTQFNFPGVFSSTQTGGLLALPSNIGTRSAQRFGTLQEVNLKLGYNLTQNLRLYVGYDFLFISSVVRPTAQMDLNVNRTQIPNAFGPQMLVGPASPAQILHDQSFWVQGFNAGLQWRY